MTRLLTGLLLGAAIVVPVAGVTQQASQLLVWNNLSDDVHRVSIFRDERPGGSLTVWLQGVSLDETSGRVSGGKGRPLDKVQAEVWMLRRDGSLLPRRTRERSRPCRAGWCTSLEAFSFDYAPTSGLAGVVVVLDGKLYSRAITAP